MQNDKLLMRYITVTLPAIRDIMMVKEAQRRTSCFLPNYEEVYLLEF